MAQQEMSDELFELVSLLKENFSWSSYSPNGEYTNICFTLDHRNTRFVELYNKYLSNEFMPIISIIFKGGKENGK